MLTGTIRPTQLKIQTKGDGKTIFCLKDRLSNWMSQRVTTIWAAGVPALHRSFADIQFDMVLCSYRCNHAGYCKILHPPFDWKIFREGPPVIRSPPQSPTKHLHCIPMPPISMHQPVFQAYIGWAFLETSMSPLQLSRPGEKGWLGGSLHPKNRRKKTSLWGPVSLQCWCHLAIPWPSRVGSSSTIWRWQKCDSWIILVLDDEIILDRIGNFDIFLGNFWNRCWITVICWLSSILFLSWSYMGKSKTN